MTIDARPVDLATAVTLLRGIVDHDHEAMCLAITTEDAKPWTVAGIIGTLFVDSVGRAHGPGACMSVDELLDSYGLAGATMAAERGQ